MARTKMTYWKKILKNPSEDYANFFKLGEEILNKNIFRNTKILDVGCGMEQF